MPTPQLPKLTRSQDSWMRKYLVDFLIISGGLLVMNLIFLADAFRETDTVNPASAGQLGDFVGGYVGTFFAIVSVVLLVRTLRSQRSAWLEQSFETKYFELIKIHRDNVSEMDVQGIIGRKIFVRLFREFRLILDAARRIAELQKQQLTQQQLLHVAYYCLFFGTGPNSSRMLKLSLSKFNSAFIDARENELNNEEVKKNARSERNLGYVPFEGHQSRLGHYYRHLYQAVCYVDRQPLDIDKYEFVKTIRAQLTTHEQALLLVNSLTPMGQDWWGNDFLLNYRMVQNIPREFFDPSTELDTASLFARGYFEWEDSEPINS